MKRVAIVGAGVIGLSSAYHLVTKFKNAVTVTVIAEEFTPNTTSDKAGGFIQPVDFNNASHDANKTEELRIQQWTVDTFNHLHSLYKSKIAAAIHLCLVSGYKFVDTSTQLPWRKNLVLGFRSFSATSPELKMLNITQPYRSKTVWAFSTYILDCRHYLPWLMNEFLKNGGTVEQRRLSSLDELQNYDVIINCSGLGAVELVGDSEVYPVRGQTVLVRAPWIKQFIVVAGKDINNVMVYVMPRFDHVVLGGTAQRDNWSETVDPVTSEAILYACTTILPALEGAEVIGALVGRRPVRKGTVRLEMEKKREGTQLVIHNYGHGGQGVTLHWGCALEVGRIIESFLTCARL